MAAKEQAYQRLPGRGTRREGLFSVTAVRSQLWLGKDHLLGIDSQWFSEDYKRFYFGDIQAIVLRATIHGKVANAIFAGLAFLGFIAAMLLTGGWAVFWGIWVAFFLVLLLINTGIGPTCVCHLKTAVQTEELPSLKRLRRARKVLARLRPLIAAAQGELMPAEIPSRMAELPQPTGAAATLAPPVIVDDPNLYPRTAPELGKQS